ncbi:MAG: AgmX/PglI C-terminal domain-containing protein [Alphaproteobacteria bacterium]|nr:AgmX/PglI C-terminal domain-containing protein [Alphaproteobacteria bacterium]MCB9791794.1 AgmX/PglI C-terminal domain-containing protein [Alphaproteobacteria bacterium]
MTSDPRAAELCPETNPSWRESLHGAPDAFSTLLGGRSAGHEIGHDLRRGPVMELAQVWNGTLMEVRHAASGALTLGVIGCDFAVPVEPIGEGPFTLLRRDGEGPFLATLRRSWKVSRRRGEVVSELGALLERGEAQALDSELVELALLPDDQLVIDVGPQLFIARVVPAGRRIAAKGRADGSILASLGFSAFLGAALALIALNQPPPSESEVYEIPDRIAEVMLKVPEKPKEEPKKAVEKRDEPKGEKAARKEGKRGEENALQLKARGDARRMEQDRQIAETAGILGRLSDNGALDDLMGGGGLNQNILGGVGGLLGVKGVQMGTNGLSSRGGGLGGGGTAVGGVDVGTKGSGSDYYAGGGDLGPKKEGGIVSVQGSLVVGALDRAQVDAVIKRNLARFRYCYQRELTRDPELSGKVVVKFVIAKDGTVSAADIKASTLGNEAVHGCMVGKMMTLEFPEPKGGGIVMVSYPFLFSPG